MGRAGIEALNVYPGVASLAVESLAEHRELDAQRVAHLLMREKTVLMPYEDAVTFAVNAARPLLDAMSAKERDRIDMVVTCTESGLDFGKSLSTFAHRYLGLKGACRLFEVKQACHSGVIGLQTAVNYVLANVSPGSKALVIATDITRFSQGKWFFAELVAGSCAVAAVVGDDPRLFEIDVGAYGCHGFEVMDTCRPFSDGGGTGDADLSFMSYLDCLDAAWADYAARVDGAEFSSTFQRLAFHTPFGGMVKGAHKRMMRNLCRASPQDIEEDFARRVAPGLIHASRLGNVMGASTLLSIASTIEHAPTDVEGRVGCFSYGSGCCSEFFSGKVPLTAKDELAPFQIGRQIDRRRPLTLAQYEALITPGVAIPFGVKDADPRADIVPEAAAAADGQRLFLRQVRDYHRQYEWS